MELSGRGWWAESERTAQLMRLSVETISWEVIENRGVEKWVWLHKGARVGTRGEVW